MKHLVSVFVLLVSLASVAAAQTPSTSNVGRGGGASATASVSVGTAAVGDLVYCVATFYNGNGASWSSIGSSPSNTWNQLGTMITVSGGTIETRWFYSVISTGGALTITSTQSAASSFPTIGCSRVTDVADVVLDRTTAQQQAAADSGSSGATSTRTAANELMLGSVVHGNGVVNFLAGSNAAWQMRTRNTNSTADGSPMMIEYFEATSTGTEAATWTAGTGEVTGQTATNVATFTFTDTSTPPPAGPLVPDDNMTTWDPGVYDGGVKGIPNRTTVCAWFNAGDYGNGTTSITTALQSAIGSCPSDQVIMFSSGTFLVNNFVLLNKDITLRGQGIGNTILKRTLPGQEGIFVVGSTRFPNEDDTTAVNLSADGTKGSYSVTVTDATGYAVGQIVKIDEEGYAVGDWSALPTNPVTGARDRWTTDRLSWPIYNPTFEFGGLPLPGGLSWHSRGGGTADVPATYYSRPISEIKKITDVTGNVITFETPIHITYRTANTAQLVRYTGDDAHIEGAGIEDMTLYGGGESNVAFTTAGNSWVKNIECTEYGIPCVQMSDSYRIEVRDSYIHHTVWPYPGGAGYAIDMRHGTSECLIENNISVYHNKVVVARSGGAGCVVAYNYMDNGYIGNYATWQEVGLTGSHMIGSHHILFEGNQSFNYDSDDTWGGSLYQTVFRNYLTGDRRDFPDVDNVRAVGLGGGNWWHAFAANVLGNPGGMSGWIYEDPGDGTYGDASSSWGDVPSVWKLGYASGDWGRYQDPLVASTTTRNANYNYLTSTVQWEVAETTIPNSLYLSAKPAFFGDLTWPWVDPTGSTKTYTLPAKQRYEQIVANRDARIPARRPRSR